MRTTAAVFAFLLASLPAQAGPRSLWLTNAWHWAGHHKAELAADFTMVAAAAADVETSYRSQSNSCRCVVETNGFLGPHPSRAQLWGVKLAFLGPLVVSNHYVRKMTEPDPGQSGLLHNAGFLAIPTIWDAANAISARRNARLIGRNPGGR